MMTGMARDLDTAAAAPHPYRSVERHLFARCTVCGLHESAARHSVVVADIEHAR